MAQKLKVGILFGGRSTEHEVSLRSAASVLAAIDRKKFTPVLLGIAKDGTWLDSSESAKLLKGERLSKHKTDLMPKLDSKKIDVVFPVLHGANGEDGSMQGFLKLINVPFVGPGILGSAVGMDKDVTKRLLVEAGIKVADGIVCRAHERPALSFSTAKKKLGLPLFVKPANAGSSVGVSKVRTEKEFRAAMSVAFKFDTKLLVEKAIIGREIEVAVIGNEYPVASIPGEIVPGDEFYSYDDKYASTSASISKIPADLPKKVVLEIQKNAVKVYSALSLEGMTRVDFFYTEEGELFVNEVNTLPGFTSISMYPKMWEASGVPFPELVTKLIECALARHTRENALVTVL